MREFTFAAPAQTMWWRAQIMGLELQRSMLWSRTLHGFVPEIPGFTHERAACFQASGALAFTDETSPLRTRMINNSTPKATFKERAHDLVEQLPEDAGWRELIYRAAVRQDIEEGLADSDAGRVTELTEVMREFGLTEE